MKCEIPGSDGYHYAVIILESDSIDSILNTNAAGSSPRLCGITSHIPYQQHCLCYILYGAPHLVGFCEHSNEHSSYVKCK